jgi:hypothetical protein
VWSREKVEQTVFRRVRPLCLILPDCMHFLNEDRNLVHSCHPPEETFTRNVEIKLTGKLYGLQRFNLYFRFFVFRLQLT